MGGGRKCYFKDAVVRIPRRVEIAVAVSRTSLSCSSLICNLEKYFSVEKLLKRNFLVPFDPIVDEYYLSVSAAHIADLAALLLRDRHNNKAPCDTMNAKLLVLTRYGMGRAGRKICRNC